jgi:carbon monoxide dehydrogenase subunit G
MALQTTGEIVVAVDQQTAFKFMEVPEQLAQCIPGCHDLRQLAPGSFSAVLTNKVSFITLSFQVTVEIVKIEPPYAIEAKITGKPVGFVGQLSASAGLHFADAGEGRTIIRYSSDVTLTGKLGGVGQPVFRAKSNEVASEFSANVKAALEKNAGERKMKLMGEGRP